MLHFARWLYQVEITAEFFDEVKTYGLPDGNFTTPWAERHVPSSPRTPIFARCAARVWRHVPPSQCTPIFTVAR